MAPTPARTPVRARTPGSTHRSPGAIRIAAGGPACGLGPTVDIDRVGILAAAPAARHIVRPRNDSAVIVGVLAAPADGRSRPTGFERLHLGGIGDLAIALIKRGTDCAADQPASRGPDHRARNAAASPAPTEKSTQRTASEGARDDPRILLPGRRIWVVGASRNRSGRETRGHELQW